EPRDNSRNSVARFRRLGNTNFVGRRTGAYDGEARSGLRLQSLPEIAGGSGGRDQPPAANLSPDQGERAGQAGSSAHIGPGSDDGADGGPGIGTNRTAR